MAALSVVAQPAFAQPKGVVPPRPVSRVDATYPREANKQHGEVVLGVTIDAEGHVQAVEVLDSAGKLLDDAAVRAAWQWTFEPAQRNGTPVAAKVRIPFHFAPPEDPPHDSVPSPPAPRLAPSNTVEEAPSPGARAIGTEAAAPSAPAPAPAGAPAAASETDPHTVTIIGHTRPPTRGASDFNIRVGQLANVPRKNAAEMLKLAPGILLTNDGGEGHAEQVFLRGFDAREGQDVEFTVGGVPINDVGHPHGNGYADTHFILPEVVESLRVVEGPFDPRQGNFAVAGSADYELGLRERGFTAKYTHGSFNTQRMLLLWGPQGETTHTFGAGELFKTDGFGQNRDARRGSVMGQYEGHIGERGTYRITGQAFAIDYHSAGVLRQDDVDAGRKQFFDTYDFNQGGNSSRYSIAADLETRTGNAFFRQQAYVIARTQRIRENFTGFLLDTQTPLQNPHGQRGDLIDMNMTSTTLGLKGFGRSRQKVLGETQEAEFGYFARADRVSGTQHRIENATQVPYHVDSDLDSTMTDLGLYGDLNLRANKWITLRGGARADLFTYNVLNNCAVDSIAHPTRDNPPGDASCLSQQDFGRYREPVQRTTTASTAVMPRGSLLLGPFAGFTFSGSIGKGVRSIDPNYITQDARTPFADILAYEGGVQFAREISKVEIVARSIFFQTKVDRDLIFSETAGRNVLGGGTTRTGWVGALRATGSFFDESFNVTFVKSTFDDTHLLVPYVPDVVVRSDTALFAPMPFRIANKEVRGTLGIGVTNVGRRPLPYGQRSDTIFTVDASASLKWTAYEVALTSTNLFDSKYRLGEYNFASDFHSQASPTLVPMRHFSAGSPRAIFVTFGITFGGEG
ncbi:TonB family protein [Pendulispora rubella]|uniref:TonB family protein n=1 Tax=Pendulispora rubella TaxID=2741070 RepID=A0ABZ2LC52_9BACT